MRLKLKFVLFVLCLSLVVPALAQRELTLKERFDYRWGQSKISTALGGDVKHDIYVINFTGPDGRKRDWAIALADNNDAKRWLVKVTPVDAKKRPTGDFHFIGRAPANEPLPSGCYKVLAPTAPPANQDGYQIDVVDMDHQYRWRVYLLKKDVKSLKVAPDGSGRINIA